MRWRIPGRSIHPEVEYQIREAAAAVTSNSTQPQYTLVYPSTNGGLLICPAGYKWVRYNGTSNCESEMVVIGRDRDGKTLVVGKAHHDGDELPAKVKPEHGIAYVSHNGKEHEKRDFEVCT